MNPRRTVLPACLLAAVLVATACAPPADDDTSPDQTTSPAPTSSSPPSSPEGETTPIPSETSTPSPEETGPVLEVSIEDDQVTPNAEEISLEVGESLLIRFTTDRGGELHVHSKPEQYVEFAAGTSEQELVIETPGSVEVEEHDTEAVVALLEVG